MSRLERIVAACGGILLDGGRRALIPGPEHSAKDRSVSLTVTEEGRLLIHCFSPKDDWRVVRRALAEKGLLDEETSASTPSRLTTPPRIAAQPAAEDRVARARRLWEEGRPIRCTPAAAYLRARVIPETLWSTQALRFHPRMTSLDDRLRRPALLAAIMDAAGGLQGVQATLLTKYGRAKAPAPTPRRIIGKLMGGAVRLHPIGDELVVAEGVETALSAAALLGRPAWALLTAGNLSRFAPPEQVKRLIVAQDNDAAGEEAARRLGERLEGRLELAFRAPEGVNDWNDLARCEAARNPRQD